MFLFATSETVPVTRKATYFFGPKGKYLNNNLLNSREQTSQFCFVKGLFHFQNYSNFDLEYK